MSDASLTVDGHDIDLSNVDKVLFGRSGITKGDLARYYRRIAEIALPHYCDRPLSMQRYPDGIGGEHFFQKNVPDYFPAWIDRIELPKKKGNVTYMVANDTATLVYLADQACITPHLSLAKCRTPDRPDRMIFDLDPSDEDFEKVQAAAKKLKRALDELELESFVQTTGSRGLHIVVPLDGAATFDAVRSFAFALAEQLSKRHEGLLTIEQRKEKRGDRVYVDCLRNAYGQTAVAPYAVRALEEAPVATPLRWDEAGAGDLGPRKYTIRNIFRRLARTEDPWAQLSGRAQSLIPRATA